MRYTAEQVVYTKVLEPSIEAAKLPVNLTKETMEEHKAKVLSKMEAYGLDAMFIYGDREHGTNFSYLTGFEPRFEEAALVLHPDGRGYLLLGNEMLSMNKFCRIETTAVHVPYFSLPNQPMETEKNLEELLRTADLREDMCIGVSGWKMFTSRMEDNEQLFDVPSFLVDTLRKITGKCGSVRSLGKLFIDPETGVRSVVNANEVAHYEFGASQAGSCVLDCMNCIEEGKTEMELASSLSAFGQPISVQTICATGERFTDGVIAPRNKKTIKGDRFSVTMGLKGGLTSRAAYVAETEMDLQESERDYLERVAKPYFAAAATWYSTIGIDITAGELYDAVAKVFPKEKYGWKLNPGHLTSDEEWFSSPVYKDSEIKLRSGMMFQMDIIPQIPGYGRAGAEDGIVLADESLREQLKIQYPEVWERMVRRRAYMEKELGIVMKKEVLPMTATAGYFRPFLLNKDWALRIRQ